MTDRPAYSFNPGPPPDAMRFLKNKGLKPAFSWADVEPEEHAVAFTVAKAMQADVLQDIREGVETALAEGQTFAQFKKNLKPSLVDKGWWGIREMVDPETGKTRTVQLGSPRRLKTIYQSNLRSARTAGQWERIQRTKAVRPYLLYQLGPSERHRAAHVAKNGLVLPVDDPFWLSWYPPNGWGCNCWVRQINKTEAEKLGIREAPLVETRPWKNWRTGEIKQVPLGIDPGWQSNPGAYRLRRMEQLLAEKLHAADPMVARVVALDVASSWRVQRLLDGSSRGAAPVAAIPEEVVTAIGSTTAVVQLGSDYVEKFEVNQRGVTPETIRLLDRALQTGRLAHEKFVGHSELHVFGGGWRFILKVLPEQQEVWVKTMYQEKRRQWPSLLKRNDVTVIRD